MGSHKNEPKHDVDVPLFQTFDHGWTFSWEEGFLVGISNLEDFPHMDFSSLEVSPGSHVEMAVEPIVRETDEHVLQ